MFRIFLSLSMRTSAAHDTIGRCHKLKEKMRLQAIPFEIIIWQIDSHQFVHGKCNTNDTQSEPCLTG